MDFTTTQLPVRPRNSTLLTLTFAGAATTLPASAALVTQTLTTPLTIGGPETVATSSVDEAIVFNPKTGAIESLRGGSLPTEWSSGHLLLVSQTIVTSTDKPTIYMVGVNTRFLAYSGPLPDSFQGLVPQPLSEPGPIGPASNWGRFKSPNPDFANLPTGLAFADSSMFPEGSRTYIGFQMDAAVPTGNQIYYQTSPNNWRDPAVPENETELKAEFIPSTTPLYGWADIGYDTDGYTLYRYAYEDSGAAISAVPEPSGSLALASLLGGSLLLRSRRKAQGSVADV